MKGLKKVKDISNDLKNCEDIKKDLVKKMKLVGTYDKSFNEIIELTSKLLEDYQNTLIEFKKSGSKIIVPFTNKNGSENLSKNPLYLAIEKLRSDVILYLRELGLTPQGLKKINANSDLKVEVKSKLDDALKKIDFIK